MFSRQDIIDQFDRIRVWTRGDERAPHKPLLVLYALGKLSRGETGTVSFRVLSPVLTDLLVEFGPSRKTQHPELPFWYLQTDGFWVVDDASQLQPRKGSSNPLKSTLLKNDAHAHSTAATLAAFAADQSLIVDVALLMLEGHFPASIHEEILNAVGLQLSLTETISRRKRDPNFRLRILTAYEYACAVCGYDVRIGNQLVGLEAAHIKWHQAGGPDEEPNGLALCSLHYKAFDLGAFTISADQVLLVSEQAHGKNGFHEWLMKFHGGSLRKPQRQDYSPRVQYLTWHREQVFKTPARIA